MTYNGFWPASLICDKVGNMPRGRYSLEQALEAKEEIQKELTAAEKNTAAPTADEYREADFEVQIETEAKERPERLRELRAWVEHLFHGHQFARLRNFIERSFDVPQFGLYHKEGMLMDVHLDLILATLEDVRAGHFPDQIPTEVKSLLQEVAKQYGEVLERYVFLHDIAKADCVRLKYTDKKTRDLNWHEWMKELPEGVQGDPAALKKFCEGRGIEGISYFHQSDKGHKQHGHEGVELIRAMGGAGVPATVLTAIDKHEVAYQFQGVKGETYAKHFAELEPTERDLVLTASYIDTMASLDRNGRPRLENFLALCSSRHNFEIVQSLRQSLGRDQSVDRHKLDRRLYALLKQKEPIEEPVDMLVSRLREECAILPS